MIGQIIDVEFEDGATNIAKIVADTGVEYHVLVLDNTKLHFYKFRDKPEVISKESVAGFYDTTDLEDTGLFMNLDGTYYEADEHSDYDTESDTSTDTEVSLDDEEF